MNRPNSIKTLISMKREKEEALSKSLSLHNSESKENPEEDEKYYVLSSPEQDFPLPEIDRAKDLLKDVDATLQNLRVWKKAEKLEFEKQIRENEQKILALNQNPEYEDSLQKYMSEIEEIQNKCSKQMEKISQKLDKEDIGVFFLKEYDESFKKIKETNQKLENLISEYQNSYGKTYETDVQHQFYKTAIESLNLDKLNKSLEKWQINIDDFYHKNKINEETEIDLKNFKKIKMEEQKVLEKSIQDSKISQKIKDEIEEIDKELEELEMILA